MPKKLKLFNLSRILITQSKTGSYHYVLNVDLTSGTRCYNPQPTVGGSVTKFYIWLASKLPKELVWYCGVRMGTHSSTGTYANKAYPEITFFEVMKDWEL